MPVLLVVGLLLAAAPRPTPDTHTPSAHVNDWAQVLPAEQARAIDAKLSRFEKDTTNQVVVAIYDTLPSEPMEDFTVATAERWGVGQKGKDNGVVFFVFIKDRKMRLEVGRGLEKALTNDKAQAILDGEATPRFRTKDFAGGIGAVVDAVMSAVGSSRR